ncbi:decaprenyl-phosphate phosphoribosyltransferase [Chloroflexota bacterium]
MIVALFKAMRPRQWVKNGVIFTGLVFDRQLGLNNIPTMLRVLAGFVIFCLVSGVVYLVNDISDVEADRRHPTKRNRPIAAGKLPIRVARIAVVVLLAIVFPISYWLSPPFALVTLGYFVLNLTYSKWIKHIVLLDVMTIAAGYVLRVVAGITLLAHVARFSPWLYVVTTSGALFLGFGKRRAELAMLADRANAHRKVLDGYTIPLLDQYINVVLSATILSYSLYTFNDPNLPVMMLTIPYVIYGIFRYLYLIQVEDSGGAPEDVLVSDRPLQLAILLWGFTVLLIFYIF